MLKNTITQRIKSSALLIATVYTSFLCLSLGACHSFDTAEDTTTVPNGDAIDPNKFKLKVTEINKDQGTDNLITVRITPGSPGMRLEEFFVTVSRKDHECIVRGSSNRHTKKAAFDYNSPLDNQHLEKIFLVNKQSNCLGKEDTHFVQGGEIAFRIRATPSTTVKEGDAYTLIIKVERKEIKPHTETKSITLTAKQDGVGTQHPTGKETTSDINLQVPDNALNTRSDSVMSPADHPIPTVDLRAHMEDRSTAEENPQTLETSPFIPLSSSALEDTVSQNTELPNQAASTDSDESDINSQIATPHTFTVTLRNETWSNHTKNFVSVTIKPNSDGMALGDFLVTATLEENKGSVKGSSDKKRHSFIYDNTLNSCSLETLFLTNVNCLGTQDTSFSSGEAVSFKIEARPSIDIGPGELYTLTVVVSHTGNHTHTVTRSVLLTAPSPSPRKAKKHRHSQQVQDD